MARHVAILVISAAFLASPIAGASSFQYFDEGINFWNKNETSDVEVVLLEEIDASKSLKSGLPVKKNKDFDWKTQLDPENEEFFREGDYLPPAAFMELVRNPSDKNIRMWFAYLEKKNALSQRLSQRMNEYSQTDKASFSKEDKITIAKRINQLPTPDDDFERYRFRMYFDSSCPHCQKMFATLNDLQDRGYFVEARQLDRGSLGHLKSMVPIVAAASDEAKNFKVDAVPLLLIGDLKKKAVYRQSGFVTPEDVLAGLRAQ